MSLNAFQLSRGLCLCFLFNDVVVGEADEGLRAVMYLVILLALRDYILFECTWFES
jgi:hypothetical protein